MVPFRVAGDSTRLLNLRKETGSGGQRPYLREGRMRGFVCASLLSVHRF
jgi:hypothetical protein